MMHGLKNLIILHKYRYIIRMHYKSRYIIRMHYKSQFKLIILNYKCKV